VNNSKLRSAVFAALVAIGVTATPAYSQTSSASPAATTVLFSGSYPTAPSAALRSKSLVWQPFTQQPGTEAPPEGGFITRSIKRFGQDQRIIYTAPFRLHNLKWDALVLGGTGGLVAADESASRNLPKSSAYISSDISNATIFGTAAIVGSTWIYGLRTGDEHAKETGELTLETLANAFTVYTAMQVLAGRERPYEGTGEGSFFRHHSVNTSFPGGHAMFTFAMAGIVAHEYPHPLVQILAYGAASAVAASRFTARQHFLSDVAVGSAIGYLISREIFYSRCKVGLGSACHHHTED
jgi:hypothetical protein